MKELIIVINSSNRADVINTHNAFPDEIVDWVVAIPKDQYDLYAGMNIPLLLIPDPTPRRLPDQRHWCMQYFRDKYKNVWFMDDDLGFFRKTDENKLIKCSEDDIVSMIYDVNAQLKKYSMVGISPRMGNNRWEEDYMDITRVNACYALNTETYEKVGAVFNPIPDFVAEDFHIALCWLNAGYPNRVLYRYAITHGACGSAGGCSAYRTFDVQKKTAFWMAKTHPEVAVKVKSSKTSWNLKKNVDGTSDRVDMIIQWKQAYKPRPVKKSFFGSK